jgi:hypothetical protein
MNIGLGKKNYTKFSIHQKSKSSEEEDDQKKDREVGDLFFEEKSDRSHYGIRFSFC